MTKANIKKALQAYSEMKFDLKQFLKTVIVFFSEHPKLHQPPLPAIHSIKSRFKDEDHLIDKINRKRSEDVIVDDKNIFNEITDLIGVRVLHLYQDQFDKIHNAIMTKVSSGDWVFFEDPKSYTWDPESLQYFQELGLIVELKESYYTSTHYLIKPRADHPICCEIQVRTLFEEIWGEIDHAINYPHPTKFSPCKEQLKVLAKLCSTGTRLGDTIFRTLRYCEQK